MKRVGHRRAKLAALGLGAFLFASTSVAAFSSALNPLLQSEISSDTQPEVAATASPAPVAIKATATANPASVRASSTEQTESTRDRHEPAPTDSNWVISPYYSNGMPI
jgi:hypothetical protein